MRGRNFSMYRLFWKLFLSFWLALVVFAGGAVFAVSAYLDHAKAKQELRGREDGFRGMVVAAQLAADEKGYPGLLDWLRERDEDQLVPLLLLDRDGRDALGREVSAGVLARLQRHQQSAREGQPDARIPITLADGRHYWLMPDLQGASLSRLVARPKVIALQVLLAALSGGAVCFVLAWYLIAPIERLRKTAALYGAGDFRHRVGPSLGRRRDEIVDLAYAMDSMAERIGNLIQSQHTLLRDVSHELRSPLARAQAAVGVARQQAGEVADAEFDRIEMEMDRLNELIGQILSYYRLDAGQRPTAAEIQEFRLDELVAEVVEENQALAAEKQCAIGFRSAPAPSPFAGSEALLYSAFTNVVHNAVRHSPPGGRIEVALDRAEGEWKIEIDDQGPGIDPGLLERVFEPFVRADASRAKNTGGFGLGLAIAKRAVEYHGGHIAARNRAGGGLAMVMHLPVAR
ncbi:MAG: two-component sensor histidine kinase [Rhodocyclaceae bacterium]|nr:two-component sensor histidine kinase [Rhodocyclaceae bacterium]